jgi:hypothetical protein
VPADPAQALHRFPRSSRYPSVLSRSPAPELGHGPDGLARPEGVPLKAVEKVVTTSGNACCRHDDLQAFLHVKALPESVGHRTESRQRVFTKFHLIVDSVA